MRHLMHWLNAAIEAQPFYSEEIRAVRFSVGIWRRSLRDPHRFPT